MNNHSTRVRLAAMLVIATLAAVAGFFGGSPAQASVGGIVIKRPLYADLTVTNVTIQTAANRPQVTTTLAAGASAPELLLIKGEPITLCATVANNGTVGVVGSLSFTTRGPTFTNWSMSPSAGVSVPAARSVQSCVSFAMPDFAYRTGCPVLAKPTPWDFHAAVSSGLDTNGSNNDGYSQDFAVYDGCLDSSMR